MLVSHTKKFIFTKTAKTAGTSVESYYEPFCMPEGDWEESHTRDEYQSETGIIGYRGNDPSGCKFYNHMPASEIRDLIGEETWKNYFKFTVIRNPFSKLVSGWYHFHRPNIKTSKTILSCAAKPTSISLLFSGKRDIHEFRTWIKNGGSIEDHDKYKIEEEVCVDYFIRHEKLIDDIRHVNSIIGIEPNERTLPRFKSGIRSSEFLISDFYDSETEDIVRRMYPWEFERFGYMMPTD